jgi:hypothetical protein
MDGKNYCQMWDELGSTGCVENWKTLWQECADWCLPSKDNITKITIGGEQKPVQRMIDTCIEANYNFATGFFSRMFPAGSIWGKFKHPLPKVNEVPAVAEYFESCSRIIHGLLAESNFTQEMQESLIDMGPFGTNCIYVEPDDDSIVNFRSFTIGSIRIGVNHKGRVDTVGREVKLNSRQMLQEFGEEALRKAGLDQIMAQISLQKNEIYTVYHLVFPRKDYNSMMKDAKNKRFASVYVCAKNKQVIRESGYDMMPYFVGRFSVGNNEVYGRSPMMNVLGTTRRTNVIYRGMIAVSELNAMPQWLTPDDDSVKGLSNRAGAVIRWRATNPNGKPERLTDNGNPAMAKEIYEMHEDDIRRAFFNHLFRPLDEYRNMTAYEVNVRQSTDLMSLTPFAGRYYDEVVSPMLSYVFYLADKAKILPEPPPELLENPKFKIEYIGQLSLATMSFETTGAFSTMNMFAEVAQYIPAAQQAFQNVDFDDVFRKTWYNNNATMTSLRPAEDVQDERAAQAQMAAQQAKEQSTLMAAQAAGMASKRPEEGSPTAKVMEAAGA